MSRPQTACPFGYKYCGRGDGVRCFAGHTELCEGAVLEEAEGLVEQVNELRARGELRARPARGGVAVSLPEVVLVTGSRTVTDAAVVASVLDRYNIGLLVHGGADGVDALAAAYAAARGIPVGPSFKIKRAGWAKYGRGAGPRRNAAMVAYVKERRGRVVAIHENRSPGTADCIYRAQQAGLRVTVYDGRGQLVL